MSALLVLLAMLAFATLASRKGYASFVAHVVTTPLLLAIGFGLSSRGLGFLSTQTAETLRPAIEVGAAWLALLVGLRAERPRRHSEFWRFSGVTFLVSLFTWIVLAISTYLALRFVGDLGLDSRGFAREGARRFGVAILIGGLLLGSSYGFARELLHDQRSQGARWVLFASRHDDLFGALAVLGAIWLWPPRSSLGAIYIEPTLAVAVVLAFGAALAFALAVIGGRKAMASDARIVIAGLLVFAGGLSSSAVLPAAVVAYFFGLFFALFSPHAPVLSRALSRTERPALIVVIALVGAHLGIGWTPLVVGVIAAVLRALIKLLVQQNLDRRETVGIPLAALLGAPGTALPFVLSFAYTRSRVITDSDVLAAIAVAVTLSEVFTLLAWLRRSAYVVEDSELSLAEFDLLDDATIVHEHDRPS